MNWLGEHGSSVMKVAHTYTLTSEECQDLYAQEILLRCLAVLAELRGQRKRGDVVLSCGTPHRDQVAQKGPTSPITAATVTSRCKSWQQRGRKCGQTEHRDTVEQLYKAIHQLPKTDAALVLLYLDQLSYQEMAEVLGISESNVGVKLNRAKKALGELMKGQSHEC